MIKLPYLTIKSHKKDVHVIRIANRDYQLGAKEKSLTKVSYETVSNRLREIWGGDAGWVQAVLFYNELQNKSSPGKRKRKSENDGKTEKNEVKREK